MHNLFTFNKSVQGFSHKIKAIPIVCQDASATFENDDYKIAIVSDGHGDPACFRSDIGSKTAVDVSLENLKLFADEIINSYAENNIADNSNKTSLYNDLKSPKLRVKRIKQLTNSIIGKWVEFILQNLKTNPITEDEYQKSGRYETSYREGKNLTHIFGATLIIALWVKDMLILIQQGDGGCTIFLEDGTIEQPVPADENCHANVTSSLCDDDALDSIRHYVVDLGGNSVIGCFLGSDGVEDSYTDVAGNHRFYKELLIKYFDIFNQDKDKLLNYLEEYLPDFSEIGSGDDVSVACIVDCNKMQNSVGDYQSDIDSYDNEQIYNRHNEKVISMTRKHSILEQIMKDAELSLKIKKEELENNERKIKKLSK